MKKCFSVLLIISVVFSTIACSASETTKTDGTVETKPDASVENTETVTKTETDIEDEVEVGDPLPSESVEDTSVPQSEPQQNDTVNTDHDNESFIPGSPVSVFTDADIEYLGIDISGTNREIAEGIRRWQAENMLYAGPETGLEDASDPMHWNYFLPGIWPSQDIIYAHVKEGKVYGICHDFAVIYCSIANYYGLQTRIANTKSTPSELQGETATTGMHIEEYNRNKSQLDKYGLDYSYDAVSSVAEETPTHYWAEVYLDGEWVVMDGSQSSTGGNTDTEFIATGDFEITDWLGRDKSAILNNFAPSLNVDDLGQTDRASGMAEVMQGIALVPYFNDAADAAEFNDAADYLTASDIMEMNQDKAAYEACSGKHLYLVSYLICDGEGLTGQAWADRYYETCGEEIDIDCALDIVSGD